MKKLLTRFLALMMVLTMTPAMAETVRNPIPDEIAELFDVPAWEEYHIPTVTGLPEYNAFVQDGDAALIILREESEDRNVLCLLEKKNGEWRITARNHEALPRGEEVPYLYCEIPGQMEVYWDNGCVYFTKENGKWLLYHVRDQARNLYAWVHDNKILYYDALNEGGKPSEESAYGIFDRRFAAFNWGNFPKTLEEARDKLTNPPITPTDFYTPETITLRANEKYDVFSAPGRDSYRAANGKAVMSTNDWVQIFGEEDGWLLVQYDISRDRMRFGYIDVSALPKNAEVQSLHWYDLPAQTIKYSTAVTDDPLASGATICMLSQGDQVRVLSSFDNWYYIETTNEYGQLLRGFVPEACIDIVYPDDMVG